MPFKKLKKAPVKRKQNGKKVAKGQASKMKQKSETEVPPKEQLTELEKEILTIQINELEGKLARKTHLCSYMEEEMSIYKKLYSGKLFLKSESMKLLNEAFQDFSSEIFLLDQEYQSMKDMYNNLCKKHHFCEEYQKRVDMLNALGSKLEEDLLESEKCFDELPVFSKAFAELEEKANTEKQNYDCVKKEIIRNFDNCVLRIQNDVNLKIEEVINDRDLKLDLLPVSWQALFSGGWLSKSWLESSNRHLELQEKENSQLKEEYEDLLQLEISTSNIIPELTVEAPLQSQEPTPSEKTDPFSELQLLQQQCIHLETEKEHQQNKIASMKAEIADLEKAIQSLELSGETYFEKSYLLQIVHKAGSIIKQEFQI